MPSAALRRMSAVLDGRWENAPWQEEEGNASIPVRNAVSDDDGYDIKLVLGYYAIMTSLDTACFSQLFIISHICIVCLEHGTGMEMQASSDKFLNDVISAHKKASLMGMGESQCQRKLAGKI